MFLFNLSLHLIAVQETNARLCGPGLSEHLHSNIGKTKKITHWWAYRKRTLRQVALVRCCRYLVVHLNKWKNAALSHWTPTSHWAGPSLSDGYTHKVSKDHWLQVFCPCCFLGLQWFDCFYTSDRCTSNSSDVVFNFTHRIIKRLLFVFKSFPVHCVKNVPLSRKVEINIRFQVHSQYNLILLVVLVPGTVAK